MDEPRFDPLDYVSAFNRRKWWFIVPVALSVVVGTLPPNAQKLINSSIDLYARVKRLDEGGLEAEAPLSPARALMGRLERGLGGHSG